MSRHQDSTRHLVGRPFARKLLNLYRQSEVLFLCCLLILTVTVVFLPSLRNDFVNYDDPDYVTANAHVQSGLTLEGANGLLSQLLPATGIR